LNIYLHRTKIVDLRLDEKLKKVVEGMNVDFIFS